MLHYLLICKSLTYAQRASRMLERRGITATVMKAPKITGVNGCGYCVKLSEKNLTKAIKALNDTNLGPTKIFVLQNDGVANEVFL